MKRNNKHFWQWKKPIQLTTIYASSEWIALFLTKFCNLFFTNIVLAFILTIDRF